MANFSAGIAASADDWFHSSDGDFGTVDTYVVVGEITGAAVTSHFGLRFSGVTIAQGFSISDATVAFRTMNYTDGTGTLLTKIVAVDEDNAAAATTAAECTTDHGLYTTAQVDWDFTLVDAEDSALTTIGFPTVVQEIVDRVGWASGNALALNIIDDGNTDKRQFVASWNHASFVEPSISITYTAVVNGSTSPATVGAISGVPAVTTTASVTVTPATVGALAGVPAVTLTAGASITPATVGAIAGVPAVTVVTPDATVSPATVGAIAGVPAVTVTADAATTPATVGAVAGVPAVTTTASVTVTPATVSAIAGVPAVTVTAGSTVTPATVGAIAGVPAVTAFTVGAVTVTIDLLAARTVTNDLLAARTLTFTRPCA